MSQAGGNKKRSSPSKKARYAKGPVGQDAKKLKRVLYANGLPAAAVRAKGWLGGEVALRRLLPAFLRRRERAAATLGLA